MYEIDGDFGQVRPVDFFAPPAELDALCGIASAGWHRCNSLYHIEREHGSPCFLLLFTVTGEGALTLDGRGYALLPGTVAIVPDGVPHAYGTPAGQQWEFYWVHPAPGAAARLCAWIAARAGALLVSRDIRPYADRVEELLLLLAGDRPPDALGRVSALTSELLCQLVLEVDGGGPARDESVSRRVIRYMEAHYAEDMRLQEMSAALYLSPACLRRRFKQETGYTPHEYLGRLRVLKARRLLRYTDLTVAGVAARVGFRDTGAFIRLYRQWEGVTPGADRKAL